jgi:hypothetical protein
MGERSKHPNKTKNKKISLLQKVGPLNGYKLGRINTNFW